jgi:type IV secretory pathway VirB2 component (pilin)
MNCSIVAFAMAAVMVLGVETVHAGQKTAAGSTAQRQRITKDTKSTKATKATKTTKTTKTTKASKTKKTTTLAKKNATASKAIAKTKKSPGGAAAPLATLSPVQQKLQGNTNLASKVSGRLPAGTDLMTASAGFRNLGQFVAAVNVSNDQQLPFAELKKRMVGDGMSLGRAMHDLRPASDSRIIAQRAENDAAATIRTTEAQASVSNAPGSLRR